MLEKRNVKTVQGSTVEPVASHHEKPCGPKLCIASAVLSGRARRRHRRNLLGGSPS